MEIDLNEIEQATPYFYNNIQDYKTWSAIGFSLATLGEQGRPFFIDISLNQNYKDSDSKLNREFNRLLTKNTGKTDIKTFFYYANLYGYKKTSIKEKRIVKPYKPEPKKAPKIDLELIKNKRYILQLFSILLNEIKENDKYFLFDRALSLETVRESQIKTLDSILNVRDNNQDLPINEDGKTVYNLIKDKRLYKPLLISLVSEYLKIEESQALSFLGEIGLLYQEKEKLFINYKYDYLIPVYDHLGNLKTIQFLADYETRAKEEKANPDFNKYSFLRSLPGEKQSLFYYPPYFKDYDKSKRLFITEGITDALSLRESIFSSKSKIQSIALLSANFAIDQDRIKELESLKGYDIFLLTDEDKAGKEATEKLRKYLKFTVLSYKKLAQLYKVNSDNIKDANDILKELRKV